MCSYVANKNKMKRKKEKEKREMNGILTKRRKEKKSPSLCPFLPQNSKSTSALSFYHIKSSYAFMLFHFNF